MTTESNLNESRSGIRSYRGRTLEEILPQIRAELGADAVVLREREGLVGGVGGFFAQRFIEVDARRGDGQSIDVYDDAPENDLRDYPGVAEISGPPRDDPHAPIQSEAGEIRVSKQETTEKLPASQAFQPDPEPPPARPSQARPFVPPSLHTKRDELPAQAPEPTPERPASTRRFETGIFMERLRDASASLPDDPVDLTADMPRGTPSAAGPPPPVAPPTAPEIPGVPPQEPPVELPTGPTFEQTEVDSALAALAEPTRKPRPRRERPKPAEGRKSRPPRAPKTTQASRRAARSLAAGEDAPTAETPAVQPIVEMASQAVPETPQQTAPQAPRPAAPPVAPPPQGFEPQPAAQPYAPTPVQTPQHPEVAARLQSAPEAQAPAHPAGNPYETVRQRPTAAPTAAPRQIRPAPRPAPTSRTTASGIGPRKYTAPPPRVVIESHRSGGRLRETLSRLLGRRRTIVLRPPAPQPLDVVAAAEVAKMLTIRGASESWTSELIDAAGAHGNPLTGNLRAAAEAEVARRILAAPALPSTGAAIAFIGAGGSGKTRCTAAIASAYRRGSTLHVTVVAIDNPEGARELSKLLADEGVPVVSLSAEQAKLAIDAGRPGGLVIVDTAATTPTDPAAVAALGAKLELLELDATYVTLPATLGPSAARRMLASFGTLDPDAVTITHADETDQLAVVVEIAISHKIPLAYFHSGTDHTNALSAIDPTAIAQELLP